MNPRKWPIPPAGHVLTATKPYAGGWWISAWFWPSGSGFHFITQAVAAANYMLEDASDEPLGEGWIATIGLTTGMLARGATVSVIEMTESMLAEIEAWRGEINVRRAEKKQR